MITKKRFDAILAGTIKATQGMSGNLTGNVTGNLTGNVTGDLIAPTQVASGDGAITIKTGTVLITKGSAAALTLADPTAGTDDGKQLEVIATTAFAHTVTIAGGLNGAGAAADVGTFGLAVANRFRVTAYNGKWWASGANVGVTFA